MNFWDKVKKDLQTGVEESLAFVREGAFVVRQKAEELTDEGKRRYRLYELQTRVQKEIAELGGKVYDLSERVANPMRERSVKAIKARIKKIETEILKLEGKPVPGKQKSSRRKPAKKAAGRQKRKKPESTQE
jgi:hypothetical protein